jgi:hypothetical protein
MNGLPPELMGLLTTQQQQMAQQRAQQQGLLNLGLALMQSSQSQPGQPKPSLGQVISRAAPVGLQAYQGSFDDTLKQIMAAEQIKQTRLQASQPKFMTIKTPDGGERLVQIPATGTPSAVQIPGLGGAASPKFDSTTSAFLSYKYPGKSFNELLPEQQREIIEFQNAPDSTKQAELQRESEKALFETGVRVPVPRGRSDLLTPSVTPAPTSSVSSGVSPVSATLPSEQPLSFTPVSQDLTPQAAQTSAIKISADLASKPLGEKEKPLIDSAAITPKAKQELLLARPKQTQAVEYVLETNSQMLSVIDELLSNKGFDDAFGFLGETISNVSGTNAARVKALLERLGGNLFIEAITAMRAASATGAAVGSVTEKEGDKLQGSRAALMQAQKAADARKELEALRETLRFQQNLVRNAYERTYGRGTFAERQQVKPPEQRKPLQSIFGGQ